jgi:non-ribosomal peptide synthetase component E (peptide arylation enzyme)
MSMKYQNLIEVITSHEHNDSKGITFIRNNKDEIYLSYKELFFKAKDMLGALQQKGFQKNNKLIFSLQIMKILYPYIGVVS